ncbi:class I SAM-dependent methyltransferase [Mangrovibacterium lignilyticum]|uniref:class I SAM-dependent methyltransferase n=1 Tax=Mangrovibacterium lignilyticum TaxID=2668052 RepID=UPI0013D1577A|nr:class I SAM-dependent methyltransferase [Mangrovibacterium lignilyticum]
MSNIDDKWNNGDPYDYFMGRWSTLMAPKFVSWLNAPANSSWIDIGCGTGALSQAIEQHGTPQRIAGVDPSASFIAQVSKRLATGAEFRLGTADHLPFGNESFEIAVSGLALNFFPNLDQALAEIKRVLKPHGLVGAYVWDYAGRMDFLRYFWDAAFEVDPTSEKLDEGIRFPLCHSVRLTEAFQQAGLVEIESTVLDIDTVFTDFDDYWNPFLGGQGPAPGYLSSLSPELQAKLKNTLSEKLPTQADGSIKLLGRALAIKGKCR